MQNQLSDEERLNLEILAQAFIGTGAMTLGAAIRKASTGAQEAAALRGVVKEQAETIAVLRTPTVGTGGTE